MQYLNRLAGLIFAFLSLSIIDTSTLNCSNNSSSLLFRCSKDSDDFCINKTQVCDIEQDCWNGEDEKQGCGMQ